MRERERGSRENRQEKTEKRESVKQPTSRVRWRGKREQERERGEEGR